MRIYILGIIFSLGLTNGLYSQKQVLKTTKGEHHKDSRLNDFLGTWKYCDDNNTFVVQFLPKRIKTVDLSMDIVVGYHLFIKMGDTLQSSFQSKDYSVNGTMENGLQNVLNINFTDLVKKKKGTARIEFVDGDKDKLRWNLGEYKREQLNVITNEKDNIPWTKGFTVPTELVLKRVRN